MPLWRTALGLGEPTAALEPGRDPRYKLADDQVRSFIGDSNQFDLMVDQVGYRAGHSNGAYEYVLIEDHQGVWMCEDPMASSANENTTFQAFRVSDDALVWEGELACGQWDPPSNQAGLNCTSVIANNPAGGVGCTPQLGLLTDTDWHQVVMNGATGASSLAICNGQQSNYFADFKHRFWIRESD